MIHHYYLMHTHIHLAVSIPNLKAFSQAHARKGDRILFRMKLWQIGLLIFLLAGALNALFVNLAVGGLPRELARLSILIGLVLFVVGLFRRKKIT